MGARTMMEQASQSPDVPSTTDPRVHTVRKERWNSIHHVHIHMHIWGWRVCARVTLAAHTCTHARLVSSSASKVSVMSVRRNGLQMPRSILS